MGIVTVEHVYKVFGKAASKAVERLQAGASAEEVRNTFDVTPAVIDASFDVADGEIFVVMGLSGSGKSTLIRTLNGLHPPTSGKVLIHGKDIAAVPAAELRRIRRDHVSMVFQHFALFPHRTVLDNAAYGLEIRGMDRAERYERAREALELVGLKGWDSRRPDALSGGMQQRVGLARALAADTDILLMDEAFSALDPLIRREMQDQLLELQSKLGKTIVFITHDLNEAMRIGDRIAMMRSGRIVQVGTAEEVLSDPANDYVAQFVADVDRSRVFDAESIMEPAVGVIGQHSGARVAHKLMRENQVPGLFCVDREKKLVGYLLESDVAELEIDDVSTVMRPVEVAVGRHTPAADLFTASAENELPLPVINEENRLLGVVPRVTLLARLGAGRPETAKESTR